LISYII